MAAVTREKWLEKISHNNLTKKKSPASLGTGEIKNNIPIDELQQIIKDLNDKIEALQNQTTISWDRRKYIVGENIEPTTRRFECEFSPMSHSEIISYNGQELTDENDYTIEGRLITLKDEFPVLESQDYIVIRYTYIKQT